MSTSISSVNNNYNASFTKRVTDDPAGSAIAQKHLLQAKGYEQGVRNGEDGLSAVKTADEALSNITGSLQRIRELSVQASSTAIYSDSDRQHLSSLPPFLYLTVFQMNYTYPFHLLLLTALSILHVRLRSVSVLHLKTM